VKSRPRLAVFCSGFGSNFEAILRAVRGGRLKADVAVLICDKPGAYALKRAARRSIPVVCLSPKLFDSKADYERFLVRILRREKIDLVVLAGFMRIFSPVFIQAFKNKIVNVHPSYLPAFKGAHAIRDAFEARPTHTGVTVHLVTVEVDAGKILEQEKVPIDPHDTLETLEKKIHAVEHRLYPKAIGDYLGKIGKS
jgi:phosphoribosylglycinamide formyltransferase-1